MTELVEMRATTRTPLAMIAVTAAAALMVAAGSARERRFPQCRCRA
jgi:hypothetical protein